MNSFKDRYCFYETKLKEKDVEIERKKKDLSKVNQEYKQLEELYKKYIETSKNQ